MKIWMDLFLTFMKIGFFTFGGGYAMIPIIEDTCVEKKKWLSHDDMMNIAVIAESTPGPIMVNLATYVGSSQAGLGGAVLATLAVVLPSFLVILLAAAVLKNLLENRYVKAVLGGLKPCVIGIILATGVYMTVHNGISGMGKPGLDLRPAAITAILAAVMWGAKPVLKRKVSPLALIAVSACLGILLYGI